MMPSKGFNGPPYKSFSVLSSGDTVLADKILKALKIDETYTKATRLPKKFDSIKQNITLHSFINKS